MSQLVTGETLSKAEIAERNECEQGILDCVENIGFYLIRIHDKRLYRDSFDSFEAYVKTQFGLSKSRAYEHLEAAKTKLRLSEISDVCPKAADIKTESQLRVLAKVPDELLPEVIDKGFENAGERKATAKDFEKAKESVVEPTKPEPSAPKQEPKAKKLSPAEQAVENAAALKEIINALRTVKAAIKAVTEVPGTELFFARVLSIQRDYDTLRQAVLVTIPHSVCPRCKGAGCPQCGNHGWVNSTMAKELEHVK